MIEKIPPLEYLWFHVHALTRENVKYTYTYIYLYIKEHSNKEVQNFTQPEMNFNEKGPSYLQLQNSRGLVTGSTSCEGPERQAYHQETAPSSPSSAGRLVGDMTGVVAACSL